MGETTSARGTFFWWLWCAIFAAAAGLAGYLQAKAASEPAIAAMLTFFAAFVMGLMLVGWYVLSGSLPWRMRFGGLIVGVSVVVGITAAVGVNGMYGDAGQPLRSRGKFFQNFISPSPGQVQSPRRDYQLPALDTRINERSKVDLATISPQDFPGFRGRDGCGIAYGAPLAEDWRAQQPEMIWRFPIGSGLSGFCIVGNYAVTQEQRGADELVTCYDLTDADVLWAHKDQTRFSEGTAGDGPRATVTIFGGRVYSMGATGILNCLDGRTGRVIWTHNVLAEHHQRNHPYGQSCSPLVFDNLVVVSFGEADGISLAAYDRETGNQLWQAGHEAASYASPIVATLAGKRQIVTVNANSVSGWDISDGSVLWNYSWPGGTKCSQPVAVAPDRVFVSADYGLGCVLLQVKADADGHFVATEVWKKAYLQTQFNNVVVHDGYVYGLDSGILCCVDLATGKLKWKNDRYGSGQVLLINDDLLVATDDGELALVPARPQKMAELTRFGALAGRMWTSPTLSRGYVIVRSDTEAVCYQLPMKRTTAPASAPSSTSPSPAN